MDSSLIWYSCIFCRKVFRERIQLVTHKKSIHLEQIKARILLKRTHASNQDDTCELEREQSTNDKDDDSSSFNENDVNNRMVPSTSGDDNNVISKITEKAGPPPPANYESTYRVNHDNEIPNAEDEDDGPVRNTPLPGTTKRLKSTSSSSTTTTQQQDCRREDNDAEINAPVHYDFVTVDKNEKNGAEKLSVHNKLRNLEDVHNNNNLDLAQETLSFTKAKIVVSQLPKDNRNLTETIVARKEQQGGCIIEQRKRKNSSSKSPERSDDDSNTKPVGGGGKKKRRTQRPFKRPKNRSVQVMCKLCKKYVREDYLSIHHQKMHVGVAQTTTTIDDHNIISTKPKRTNPTQSSSASSSTMIENKRTAETGSSHSRHEYVNKKNRPKEENHQRPVNVPKVLKSVAHDDEQKELTQTQNPQTGKTASSPPPPPLSCEFCPKTFKSSVYFDRHVVIHTPFKCVPCNKTFWYWQSFTNHKHSVH